MFRRVSCFLVVILLVIATPIESLAYNINASHAVNQTLNMPEERKKIWQNLRAKGYSEEATAGIMGNFGQESGCNRTVTQSHRSWGSFSYGSFGLGLAQWTSSGRQKNLFKVADKYGKQWMDLDVQLEHFENEMKTQRWKGASSSVNSLEDFKKLKNIDEAVVVFEDVYERAGKPNMANRKKFAHQYFEELTGTPAGSSGSSEETTTEEKEEVKTTAYKIIDEWDLTGMPSKSGILSDAENTVLPTYDDLSTGEKYSMQIIKDDMEVENSYRVMDFVRVGVVFCGLVLILFALAVIVAYNFDRVNVFFDISLLSIITFGKLKYSSEDREMEGYVSGGKLIKIIIICFLLGMFLITGSMFNVVLRVYSLVALGL